MELCPPCWVDSRPQELAQRVPDGGSSADGFEVLWCVIEKSLKIQK